MNSEALTTKIGEQDWLEPLEDGLQKGVEGAFKVGGEIGKQAANVLHGTWLGHPLHPALVSVPLGAWTVAAVLDISDAVTGNEHFSRASDAAIGIGLIGAAGAAVTGLTDWHKTDGKERRVGMVHGILNLAATALYVSSWVLRKQRKRDAARITGWLGFAVSGAAGYLGGHLVSSQKVGVDHADRTPLPDGFTAVMKAEDLPENTPKQVEVEGIKIVLVRQGTKIYALQDACAHLGGPLSEGAVEGDTICCPWHGSCFALKDGQIKNGPTTFPQPAYEVRVKDGHIELRNLQIGGEKQKAPALAAN